MPIRSKLVFTTLDSAFEELKQQITEVLPKTQQIYLSAWMGYGKGLHFKLEAGEYGTRESVEGVDLQEMVEEMIRRIGFKTRQGQLLLAPVIEGAATKPASDDEVPF